MAGPITWRNVDGPTPAAAAGLFRSAADTTNGAFDIFSKLIQQRQAVDQANVGALDESNKQAYLDTLQNAKTPEEVAALETQLATQRAGLSSAAKASIRGAAEARITSTRQNDIAAQAFQDTLLARAEAPVLAQHNTLVANGDIKGAEAFRLANPQVRDWSGATQKAYDTGRARTTNAQTDAVAAATQPNLLAAQAQITATQPQRNALQVQQLNLTGSTQTAAQQAADDAQQLRRLETRLAMEAQENAANQDAIGGLHRKVADRLVNMDLPRTATGTPDFANMSEVQQDAFNALAKQMGIPPSTVVTNGDTARGDALTKRLAASGEFSPSILRANEQAIRSSITSSAPGLVGNDAVAVARATAENNVAFDHVDANSWYGAGSENARKAYSALAGRVGELLADNTTGFGKQNDIQPIQVLLGELAASGIKTTSGQYIVPSANDVERFIRGSEGGWFQDTTRKENIKVALKEWLDSPAGLKMVEEGEKSINYRMKQKVVQMQREILNPTAPKK